MSCQTVSTQHTFYVDVIKGNDSNGGSLIAPFQSIQKALDVVSSRVEKNILSDTIFIRGGVYKSDKTSTLYLLNLKGTEKNYAVLSAMPCKPNAPNGVQRKSGQWYEKVVFDDGYIIDTKWVRYPDKADVWVTNPGYQQLDWIYTNLWPWRRFSDYVQKFDKASNPTIPFTVAPYMLLQDGEPTFWADRLTELSDSGTRYYNQESGELFCWSVTRTL